MINQFIEALADVLNIDLQTLSHLTQEEQLRALEEAQAKELLTV